VLVVSKGDNELLQLNGYRAWHFPQTESGSYAGFHPRDSADAIHHLEELRTRGAEYLLFPRTAFWWLEHYKELKNRLESRHTLVCRDEACVIYGLTTPAVPAAPRLSLSRGAATRPVRLIAFYLPQFHPIPENDEWWGEGFTEWRNVAKADPQFTGHYQPHVPADLGFYDLRLAETREQQAAMARNYGIHGFCYYHYWFNGKRLLERPFEEVLASGKPDFPFCLCWANDPWSRRWDGREDELLQAQTYSGEDDLRHIEALIPALSDPRAITVEGKPVFLVYRGRHLPHAAKTIRLWRKKVRDAGLPGIHLIAVETAWDLGWDATAAGFDAKVLFQPQFGRLITHASHNGTRHAVAGKDRLQVYDYRAAVAELNRIEPVRYRRYETVVPGWDNTARVGENAVVLHESSPEAYEQWLRRAVDRARRNPPDHRLVFLNAWNEWAEGCHLEPDVRHGLAYLEATARAVTTAAQTAVAVQGYRRG
jgi:lipopolysaccharide biosynthesis protein